MSSMRTIRPRLAATLMLGVHQLGAAPGPPPDLPEHPDRRQ